MPLVLPASFAGKTIACSRCGHAVLVSDPTAAAPATSHLVSPPHLSAGRDSPLLPAVAVAGDIEPAEEDEPDEAPRKRSCLVSGCLTLVVAALSVAAVVGVALLTVYLVQWKQTGPATDGDEGSQTRRINKREYTDASRKALTIDGVTVRIDKVQVGKVDFRSKGEILQSKTPHYLIVNVSVKNKSRSEPVLYQSWYDQKFEDDQGQSYDVELQDDNGRPWSVFAVPDADKVEQHFKSEASLPTDDEIIDSLIFKLPEEYVDEPIPPLFLALPGAAVGNPGEHYRFKLPAIMIDRRDR
jgi:hypothetical protein